MLKITEEHSKFIKEWQEIFAELKKKKTKEFSASKLIRQREIRWNRNYGRYLAHQTDK